MKSFQREFDISLLLPVYNVKPYLERCLQSIGQLTCRLEIIAIDDGSTDGSADFLEAYQKKDPRLFLWRQENQGVEYTRNRALSLARGRYVKFLDPDDELYPGALEKLYALAEESQAVLVFHEHQQLSLQDDKTWIVEEFTRLSELDDSPFPWIYWTAFSPRMPHNVWNYFYRRDYLETLHLNFKEEIISSDLAFTRFVALCAYKQGKSVVYCQEPLVRYYFFRPGSIGRTKGRRSALVFESLAYFQELIKREDFWEGAVRDGFSILSAYVILHRLTIIVRGGWRSLRAQGLFLDDWHFIEAFSRRFAHVQGLDSWRIFWPLSQRFSSSFSGIPRFLWLYYAWKLSFIKRWGDQQQRSFVRRMFVFFDAIFDEFLHRLYGIALFLRSFLMKK